jgi:hypothetical protein
MASGRWASWPKPLLEGKQSRIRKVTDHLGSETMITRSIKEPFRSELVGCLTRLAAPADEQVKYLKEIGVYPSIDEIALEFHDVALLVPGKTSAGEMSTATKVAIERLDSQLSSFSGDVNAHLWTPDALASAKEWHQVRSLASECLRVLGVA